MRRFRHPIILDTGPLLTYLCWLFLDHIEATGGRRLDAVSALQLNGLRWNDDCRIKLQGIIQTPGCMTTTLVLHELLQLRKNSFLEGFTEYRPFALDKLREYLEVCVPLNEVADEMVLRFGLTDAGLLQIAQRRRGTLLTTDARLYEALDSEVLFDIVLLKDAIEG